MLCGGGARRRCCRLVCAVPFLVLGLTVFAPVLVGLLTCSIVGVYSIQYLVMLGRKKFKKDEGENEEEDEEAAICRLGS